MKNDRLFQLLYLLLEKGKMSAPELAEKLEVSVRTIYRDVESLAMAGVPIYTSMGKRGGISLLPGFTLDKSLLSEEEQDQLFFALQSLRAADQEVDALLRKLRAIFRRSPTDWILVDFSRWGLQGPDTERFEIIRNAILKGEVLSITYCGAAGQKSERRIHPLRLVYKGRNWYLQAFCERAADYRLFKVGRIIKTIPTGDAFAPENYGRLPPIELDSPPSEETSLSLRFSPQMAYRVYDEFDHSSIEEESSGHLRADINFPMDSWVISYLLSFGTEVEILAPAWLREQIQTYAKKISLHHKT